MPNLVGNSENRLTRVAAQLSDVKRKSTYYKLPNRKQNTVKDNYYTY